MDTSAAKTPFKETAKLIGAFKKTGLKNYKQAFADGELEFTTVKLYVPTGIVPLDEILGGGFPAGRISEIFGPEQSFKTGLASMAMETLLYMGGYGIYYDNEETFDEGKSVLQNQECFLYSIIQSLESFYVDVKAKLKVVAEVPEARSLILWDSMPATLPNQLLESDEGDRTLGEAARIHAIELPRIKTLVRQSLCAFIAINQVRANMHMMNRFDNPFTTPGGYAPKFWATLRLFVAKKGRFQWFSESKTTDGVYVEARVEKNKNSQPFIKASFPIVYADKRGGDPAMSFFDWLVDNKFISPTGAGRWSCSEIIGDLKVTKWEFHSAYLENLDAFLGFFESKTNFRYAELPLLGVRELTKRMYSNTTKIERDKLR
jgi:recombination protein RecA